MDVGKTLKRYWPWAVIPLLLGVLLAVYRYLGVVASGASEPFATILVKEMSAVVGTVLLLWPLVSLHRRFPLFSREGVRALPIHVVGVLAYSAIHTSWNWASRSVLYPLLGFGTYNYGRMPTRYFMEFPLDLIVYVIVAVIVLVLERTQAARAKELQVATLREQVQRTRLTQLQSQLRPHFLFNSLNTVSSVMYEDVDRADGVLQSLSDVLRRMVDQSDETVIPLAEELRLIRSAVDIMEARFQDRLHVRIEVDSAAMEWPVPPLILQPLVENAFQHGMGDGTDSLEVVLTALVRNERLRVELTDNGPGLNGDPFGSAKGVGLRNTRDRLAAQYGGDETFELKNGREGGVHIVMEIPWTRFAP